MSVLVFENAEFLDGVNVTVRRGDKWDGFAGHRVEVEDSEGYIGDSLIIGTLTMNFAHVYSGLIQREHDPSCRTLAGLEAELRKIYPGFNGREDVTLVFFFPPSDHK